MRVVIFGAGASAYCCGCQGDGRPPLGHELLDRVFANAPELEGGLPSDMVKDFRTVGHTEAAMERLFNDFDSLKNTPIYREISRLLVSLDACSCRENAYRILVRGTRSHPARTVLTTLNYDLLLEHALAAEDVAFEYSSTPKIPSKMKVLKPHGSVNFLPDIGNATISGNSIRGCRSYVDTRIHPVSLDPRAVHAWLADPRYQDFAPAISAYIPQKNVLFSSSTVLAQREEFEAVLQASSRVAIVGVSFNSADVHVWGRIDKQRVLIIEPYPSEGLKDWIAARPATRTLVRLGFEKCAASVARFLSDV